MDETTQVRRAPDTLEAWQQALAEVPPTPALSGALRRRADLFERFTAWYGRLRSRPRAERRRWQRQLGLSLAGIALLLAVNGAPAGAASPTATINVDGVTCTLADAITAANTNAAVGGCTAGSGADTLNLTANIGLTAALPAITTPITIEGNGNTISRQTGSPDFRILTVTSGGNLTLNSATVSGGTAPGGFPTGYGGGIYARSATLTVNDSTLSNNLAVGWGGGIFAWSVALTVNNSTISSNSTNFVGGGISAFGNSSVTILGSNISNNSAADDGGGIDLRSSTLTVSNSTISSNSTNTDGGGIHATSASLAISNSSILTNTANNSSGGGINAVLSRIELMYSTVSGNLAIYGGGILPSGNSAAISNSTVSGNSAVVGGGIYGFSSATVTVSNSTISGNSGVLGGGIRTANSSSVMVLSSIVANQTAGGDCSNAATLTSGDYNIESGTSCGFTQASDLQNVSSASLALGPLADNGGPTQTRLLGALSVAIDRIPVDALEANGCGATVTTDQRGAPRAGGIGNGGLACDVGAYESDSAPPLAVTLASFDAQAMLDHILLSWETVSEANNAGFNLYRSASPAAPDALLAFVPSQAPGSTVGASYSFDDTAVSAGQTWYYWLEDVDLNGATSLHGPVSATLPAPTAVTLDALHAQAAIPDGVSIWSVLVASLIAAAGAIGVRRRARVR